MRNAEATRDRILEAAMAEFSAHGVAGARVDRIAAAAGCNKNLIYVYFQSKEKLFATVLQKTLTRVYDELAFTPDDLPAFAGRVFDFAMANPDLMRLIAWFGLENTIESPPERGRSMGERAGALKKAQNAGQVSRGFSPTFLLTTILTLATAWTAANPFGPSLDQEDAKQPSQLRRNIVDAVVLLTEPDLKGRSNK